MQGASAGTRSKGGTGGVYQLAPATHTLSSCGALLATRRGDLARASEGKEEEKKRDRQRGCGDGGGLRLVACLLVYGVSLDSSRLTAAALLLLFIPPFSIHPTRFPSILSRSRPTPRSPPPHLPDTSPPSCTCCHPGPGTAFRDVTRHVPAHLDSLASLESPIWELAAAVVSRPVSALAASSGRTGPSRF